MIGQGGGSAGDRITWAYRRAVARAPASEETAALEQLLEKQRARYQTDEKSAGELIHVGEWPVPDDIPPAELAAWTTLRPAPTEAALDGLQIRPTAGFLVHSAAEAV